MAPSRFRRLPQENIWDTYEKAGGNWDQIDIPEDPWDVVKAKESIINREDYQVGG